MSPDRVALAGLRKRYEVARAVLWALLAAILVIGLVTMAVLLHDVRARQAEALRNQATLQKLQEQNRALLEAQQSAATQRTKVVSDAITELARREQVQLDEMENRNRDRLAVIVMLLRQIRSGETGQVSPDVLLLPVPLRPTPTPGPTPTPPQAQPQATCEPRGHSGKCK